jgi:hypothetical protein
LFTAATYSGAAIEPTTNYVFIGKVDQWPDDNNPPLPTQDQRTLKQVYKNGVAAKLILTSNLSAVVPRFDWTSGTIYSQYNDYENMFTVDTNGVLTKKFYVRNNVDQVFKCLSNNKGAASTVQPILAPGNTDPGQTIYTTDGYKWIYVTTIDKGLKQKFFDNDWMPIGVGNHIPNTLTALDATARMGSINAINVVNAGNNYTNGLTTTTITISGDGKGATAYANVSGNIVSDIIVTNSGNNYTYATVSIAPALGFTGSNATANASISPIGGHGYDPVSELGCNHIMLSLEFDGSENGILPTDISFRQVGLMVNPLLADGTLPTDFVYGMYDSATVSFGTGNFTSGETVYQGLTLDTATFTATCCSFDTGNNIVSLINTTGDYAIGSLLNGATSGASRVLLSYEPTNFDVGSGYMMYYENRVPVQRSANDNQQIRLVLRF